MASRRSSRVNGTEEAGAENEVVEEETETATSTKAEEGETSTTTPVESETKSTDVCPSCTPETISLLDDEIKEEWAQCGACKVWYHWRCAGQGVDLDTIDKWYAEPLAEGSII